MLVVVVVAMVMVVLLPLLVKALMLWDGAVSAALIDVLVIGMLAGVTTEELGVVTNILTCM